MASNKEFIEQAEKLAGELNKEIVTEGLNNAQLGALVKNLKAEADAKAKAEADAKAKAEADAKAQKGKKKVILQSRYGEKGPGDTISLPTAQADQMVADGWADLPKKEK